MLKKALIIDYLLIIITILYLVNNEKFNNINNLNNEIKKYESMKLEIENNQQKILTYNNYINAEKEFLNTIEKLKKEKVKSSQEKIELINNIAKIK